jgi:hypothetical protein
MNSERLPEQSLDENNWAWAQIQARIQAANTNNGLETTVPPPVVFPGKPADIVYDVALYKQLELAAEKIPHFERDLLLHETGWSRLPLIGSLLQKVRQSLHSIALFYTNRALQHQQAVNQHLWEAVGRLTAVTQQQQRTIEAMQAQLAANSQPKS